MKQTDRKIYVLIFLHLAVALPLAYFLNIWMDEGSTLHSTQNGFSHAFQNVFADEKQAPLYFLILSLWRGINDSIFFARLFSILCSLLAIKFFYDLARQLLEDKTAFFIALAFTLHPFLFWASLEIRVYSAVILLSVLLLKFFAEGYLNQENFSGAAPGETRNSKSVRLYIFFSIVALYTNYNLGFLLVGCFAALLILRRRKAAEAYFLHMIVVGAAFLPLIFVIKSQIVTNTDRFQAEKPFIGGLKLLWNHVLTFVLPTEIFPPEDISVFSTVRIWVVRIAVLAIGAVTLKNRGHNLDRNVLAFGAISAVGGLFLFIVYLFLGSDYVEIRHASMLFAPFFLFTALILSKILPEKSWFLIAALLALSFSYSLFTLHPNLTKRGDWARVGAYIRENEEPHQPVIVFPAYEAISLPYHYNGINRILPDEKFFVFDLEDEFGSADSHRRQIEFVISKIPPAAAKIWLVTYENCSVTDACQPLENFVEAHYTVERTQDFYKERVRLLRKK